MVSSQVVARTAHFYEWEKRGRGWHLHHVPIDIEPPFEYFSSFQTTQTAITDEGHVPGIWSMLTKAFQRKEEALALPPIQEVVPHEMESSNFISAYTITLPKGRVVTGEEAQHLLLMLASCSYPVSFEIIATSENIALQLVCREQESEYLTNQVKAYFPDALLTDTSDTLHDILAPLTATSIVDLGLREEFMRPLAMQEDFSIDPLVGFFGTLQSLYAGKQVVLQILFKGTVDPWSESIIQSVTSSDGKSFFLDAPEMPKLAREKVSEPLFGVVIRVAGQAYTSSRAEQLVGQTADSIILATRSPYNALTILSNEGYPLQTHASDILFRQSHRLGMLLNTKELVRLVHFPSASVVTPKLNAQIQKTQLAPSITRTGELVLGTNVHQGVSAEIRLPSEQRMRHLHIIGATGTGKSTLLLNLIMQDIESGRGCAVLDPHGDLVDEIISRIPKNRIKDVLVVDPSDSSFPVAFNILHAHSEIEKNVLSSDLVAIFRKLSTSWGDAMNSIFAHAILAFLESSEGGTLMDLRRFLVEKSFRDEFLKTVNDPSELYYWNKEYPLIKSSSIGPILTKLDTFLRPKLIRNMVAQKKGLHFEHLMDSQKILLLKVSQGLIGTENSYLLGSMFVAKLHQTALARQAQSKETRKDFHVYIDEFQHFLTPSMIHILSGARKYHIGLTLAHQDMQQLVKSDSELADAVLSNVGTRVCFRLGDNDAKRLEGGLAHFDANDLRGLQTGQAIVRVNTPEQDFNIGVTPLAKQDTLEAETTRNAVIAASRDTYATSREVVEASLAYLHKQVESVSEVKNEVEELPLEKETTNEPVVIPQIDTIDIEKSKERLIRQKEVSQHRYLQTLIKKMAESRGYKASLEVPTSDGKGRVDVCLERNGKQIACEIGVTTTQEWEIHNIHKCISAGYKMVVAISTDKRVRDAMQKRIQQELQGEVDNVQVLSPEELFHFLDSEIVKDTQTETRMKGYRVKVEYSDVTQTDMEIKKRSITKVILDTIKKKKE